MTCGKRGRQAQRRRACIECGPAQSRVWYKAVARHKTEFRYKAVARHKTECWYKAVVRCKTVCWHKAAGRYKTAAWHEGSTDAKILGDKGEDLSIFSRIAELTGGERPEKT